jgi:signal transduction histidine kinase
VHIQLALRDGGFEIAIEDDGAGFDSNAPVKRSGGGNGLDNMRERLRHIDGRFECHSRPGQGTRIVFQVPAQAQTARPEETKRPSR